MISKVRQTRQRLIIVLGVLLFVDLAAGVVLLSPVGHSRQDEIQSLQSQLRAKMQQVQPLRGLDKKVVVAKEEIADFYRDRLPGQYSDISDRVGKMAAQSNIKIVQAKYSPQDIEASGLRPVLIEAGLSGDYVHIVKFINSLERDKTLFIVNSVALGDAQGGTVKLQLKMETYLKSGA